MRWLITLSLALVVAAGAAVLLFPDKTLKPLGLVQAPPAKSGTSALAEDLKPAKVTKLELTVPGQATLVLTKNPDGTWGQPGGWPVREKEVEELVAAIGGIRTRYLPIAVADDAGFSEYGLGDPAKVVRVVAHVGDKVETLTFGQPAPKPGQSATSLPAYVRIDNSKELLKIAPDVLSVVSRPPESYRRRQLFLDSERIKFAGGSGRNPLVGNATTSVQVEGPDGKFKVNRLQPTPAPRRDPGERSQDPVLAANDLADVWELTDPVKDRVDPTKLKTLLTAIPDLWVDGFTDKKADAAGLADTGLDKPERSVIVTPAKGNPVALRIGKVSRTTTRKEPGIPMGPVPPMPREVIENYHYAKFDGNDFIFEIKSDRFPDLFAKADDLRDATLARFDTGDVQSLTIAVPKQPEIVITKRKGNKDAEREEDKQDRWYVGNRLAEASKVTELLDQLSRLDAKAPTDRIDSPDAAKLGENGLAMDFTTITLVAQTKAAEGDQPPPAKTFKFQVGKDDAEKKKLAVRMEGWPRLNLVDDAVAKNIGRPELAYRSRKLFDTAEVKLSGVKVQKAGGEAFGLASKPKAGAGNVWALTQPVSIDTDETKSSQLTGDISRLEAVDFVDDTPKPEDLMGKYGLAMPRYTLDLEFTGTGAKPAKLLIGAAKEGGAEVYARLNDGGVFTINKPLVEALERGALDLLPLALWTTQPEKVTSFSIQRGEGLKDSYKLSSDNGAWKLAGPFDAAASGPEATGLAGGMAAIKAEKYVDFKADPAKHGFDKPAMKFSITFKEPKPDGTANPPEEVAVTRTLLVGKPTENPAQRYAMLEGGANTAVFTLADDVVKTADQPALHWLDRNLLQQDPSKIARVEIQGGNTEKIVLVKDEKGNFKPENATFPLDKSILGNFLFNAASPPVVRLAAYGPAVKWADYGFEPPSFTITTTTAGEMPAKHTIQLGKEEPTGERYVRIDNGPAVAVVSGATSAALARGKLELIERTLLAFDPQQLTAISRKVGGKDFELGQVGLGWEVTKPTKFKADAPTIEELLAQLSALKATKVAAYDPKDRKPFGLDAPAATVTLKVGLEKPEDKVLLLGKPVEDGKPEGPRFAMIETKGEATVGVLPAAIANRLLQDPIRFKDKALAKFVDADKLVVTRGDRKATFAKVNGTWKLTEPANADAEQSELDELVDAVAKLRADDIVAEKPGDLKPFGLDAPSSRLQFSSGDKEVLDLLLGSKEKDGNRIHGKLEKGDLVVLFDIPMSNRLQAEYRKRAVWSGVDASQIQTLAISSGTSNFSFRKTGSAWIDPSRPGDAVDPARVTETLAALAGLKAQRYAVDQKADLKLYGLDKPSRVIALSQQGGIQKTLLIGGEVGGTDGKQVYAKVQEDGRSDVFVLGEAETALFRKDRSAYLVGK
jgi:hypothetical protein